MRTPLESVAAELAARIRCIECRTLVYRTIAGLCDECRDEYEGADCGA